MNSKFILIVFCTLALLGCANKTSEPAEEYVDTLEPFNRAMHNFNFKVLDPYLYRPAAVVWKSVFPKPIRKGVVNVSSNLSEPTSVAYNLIQGKVRKANISLARFMINTLFGFGGLIDVASMADPQLKKENSPEQAFDDVLENYNIANGTYVVLPFFNGITPRKLVSKAVDIVADKYLNPLNYVSLPINYTPYVLNIFEALESRVDLMEYENLFDQMPDPYIFMRNSTLKISSKPSKQLSDEDHDIGDLSDIDN